MEEKSLKTVAKMLMTAVFSLTIGVAFASPMLISDINNKPEMQTLQDRTSDFNVEVIYSNYTAPNNSSFAYQIPVKATSLAGSNLTAEIAAKIVYLNTTNADKIVNSLNRNDSTINYHAPDIGCPWERILVYERIENNTGVAVYLWRPTNVTAAQIFVENMTK